MSTKVPAIGLARISLGLLVGTALLCGSCDCRPRHHGTFVISGRLVGYSADEEVRVTLSARNSCCSEIGPVAGAWQRIDEQGRFSLATPSVPFRADIGDGFSLLQSARATTSISILRFYLGVFRQGQPPLAVEISPALKGTPSDLGRLSIELPDIDISHAFEQGRDSCDLRPVRRSDAIVAYQDCPRYDIKPSDILPGCDWVPLPSGGRVCLNPNHPARRDPQAMARHLEPIWRDWYLAGGNSWPADVLEKSYRRMHEALGGGFWWFQ